MPHGGRHFYWVDRLLDEQVASGTVNQTNNLFQTIPISESRVGMTIMRTILCLDVAHLIPDSGEGIQNVAMGIGITGADAFASNVVADPEIDADFPMGGWVFRCRVRTYGFAADSPSVYNRVIERDLRGKRKVNNGEVFWVTSNLPEQGTPSTIVVHGIVRMLILST